MFTPAQTQQPSPTLFFESLNAYQWTASLKAAIELEVFTAIREGNTEPKSLAARRKTSERGMRILCDYRNAGFSRGEFQPLPPTFEQVIISQK